MPEARFKSASVLKDKGTELPWRLTLEKFLVSVRKISLNLFGLGMRICSLKFYLIRQGRMGQMRDVRATGVQRQARKL